MLEPIELRFRSPEAMFLSHATEICFWRLSGHGNVSIEAVDGVVGTKMRMPGMRGLSFLNAYPKITKLVLRGGGTASGICLDELKFLKSVCCDYSSLATVVFGEKLETISADSSDLGGILDLSHCNCLQNVTLAWCKNLQSIAFPPSLQEIKVGGMWAVEDLENLVRECIQQNVHMHVVDNAWCRHADGRLEEFANFYDRMALRMRGPAGASGVDLGGAPMLSRCCKVSVKKDPFDGSFIIKGLDDKGESVGSLRASNLDVLASFANVKELELSDMCWEDKGDLDLCAATAHVETVRLSRCTISHGSLICGAATRKVSISYSDIEGGLNCSRCTDLEEVVLDSCLNLVSWAKTYYSSNRASVRMGVLDVSAPPSLKKSISIKITGLWEKESHKALLFNLGDDFSNVIDKAYFLQSRRSMMSKELKLLLLKKEFAVLGIEPVDDRATVQKVYRNLALECHPDKNPGNATEATAKFQEIESAWGKICDDMGWR
ncbi:MAG: DnaJ domain-containing protein [Puniceicoccales bacterium]|nr:DnaJ domain-containing protein [Puniceicoccales bacterium]